MPKPTLVIDDDPSFNAILVRTLERRGHPARGALDTGEALALAREIVPHRVVLDLNLNGQFGPGADAGTAGDQCRLPDRRADRLPASIATAVDAIKLGAIQYLAKPVEIEAIIGAFENDETRI